jgi:hypothetical protein
VSPLHHNFHEHPLLQLDRIEQLAKSLLPSGQCRFMKPVESQASNFHHEAIKPDLRDLDAVFRRLDEPGTWVALYYVEKDPIYAQLVEDALATVRPYIDRYQPGMFSARGYIFISAPPAVTPFHIDSENNFWLQIRGRKIMNVWEASDRDIVSGKAVEDFIIDRSLDGVKFDESLRARSYELNCGPGDGVYFPSTAPHATRCEKDWVRPGDGVSISMAMVFYSNVTRRHANVHAFNRVLRRFGLDPRSPGVSSTVDRLKYPFGRAIVDIKARLGRFTPPPGF